jgi:hypothetical protein
MVGYILLGNGWIAPPYLSAHKGIYKQAGLASCMADIPGWLELVNMYGIGKRKDYYQDGQMKSNWKFPCIAYH